jgi:hypothetical protein
MSHAFTFHCATVSPLLHHHSTLGHESLIIAKSIGHVTPYEFHFSVAFDAHFSPFPSATELSPSAPLASVLPLLSLTASSFSFLFFHLIVVYKAFVANACLLSLDVTHSFISVSPHLVIPVTLRLIWNNPLIYLPSPSFTSFQLMDIDAKNSQRNRIKFNLTIHLMSHTLLWSGI